MILDPITKNEEPLAKDDSVGWMFDAKSSPVGEKVALFWNRRPSGLWIISLEDHSEIHLRNGILSPVTWSKDGKRIYAVTNQTTPQKLLMIQVPGGQSKTLWTMPENSEIQSMTPDSQRIIYSISEEKSDVWLVENFDPDLE